MVVSILLLALRRASTRSSDSQWCRSPPAALVRQAAYVRSGGAHTGGRQIATVTATMAVSVTKSCATGSGGSRPRATSLRSDSIGAYLALEPCTSRCKRITGYFFVDMDSLSVLAKIVKSGKPPIAMTLERPLSGVLSNMPCQMFAASETQTTWRKVGAVESLSLLLLPWSLSIASGTIVVRVILIFVVITHFNILVFISFREL